MSYPIQEAVEALDFRIPEANESLETVGMLSFADRSFSTLSGGEQQRVILAHALAQQTPCLCLDEPTNHLDIKYQLQLIDLVRSLDRTVIAVVHDLNIAAMYCDRLYALKDGQIVGEGAPKELLTPILSAGSMRWIPRSSQTIWAACISCIIPNTWKERFYEANRGFDLSAGM